MSRVAMMETEVGNAALYDTRNVAISTTSFEEVVDLAHGLHQLKQDHKTPCSNIRFTAADPHGRESGELRMLLPGGMFGDINLPLSDRAFYQACGRLDMPSRYFKRVPANLALPHFNHWVAEQGEKEWFVRDIRDEDGDERSARAVLSSAYRTIDNWKVLDVAHRVMQKSKDDLGEYKLVRPYLTPDRVCLTVVFPQMDALSTAPQFGIPARERGNYSFGFRISNSEVGTGSLYIIPIVQRNSCENSITWVQGGLVQAHIGMAATSAYKAASVAEYTGRCLGLAPHLLESIVAAESEKIPTLAVTIDKIMEQYRLPKAVRDDIVIGTEGNRSRMGVVNGLSYAAHQSLVKQEDRELLENIAGATLAQGLFAPVHKRGQVVDETVDA